ncbi:MAG TPA: metal-dependent hydrolase [Leptolyngbya sp.]|nr:metal-dependent hydrolase [Leptolyngbya sp.]
MILKRFLRFVFPLTLVIAVFIFGTTTHITPQAGSASAASTSKTQLQWYGQSAFKLTTPSGKVLLIDPWITNPVNPNGKAELAALDRADLVLITHGHFDHVGDAIAIAKKTKAPLVSTADLGQALVNVGYPKDLVSNETQGNFGGELTLLNNEIKVAFIPAVHSSAIAADGSAAEYAGNPGGFLITVQNGPVIYHTGDTDVFVDMALIPEIRKVTLMLACIGDHFTMGPKRAATAVSFVKPDTVIPMHFGTFPALTGTPAAFQAELDRQNVKSKLQVLKVGQTIQL